MTEHTPTPWKVKVSRVNHLGYGQVEFNPPVVASDEEGMFVKVADGRFIERACNSHDELVEALGNLRKLYEDYHFRVTGGFSATMYGSDIVLAARAALAKAIKEQP